MFVDWRALVSRIFVAVATLFAGALIVTDVAQGAASEAGTYRVKDGSVDANTFQGWRVYQSACALCHGQSAGGTQIAPSLLKRMEALSTEEFARAVLVRYRLLPQPDDRSVEERERAREEIIAEVKAKQRGRKGQVNMPAWETDAQVNAHILDLYAYLSARADGAIGPHRPGVLPGK